LNSFKDYFS